MNSQNKTRHSYIVFSKWSRKSYAIFASLKKVVKIARLATDVCNVAVCKITNAIILFGNESLKLFCFNEEVNEYELLQFETLEIIVVEPNAPINLFDINKRKILRRSLYC